MNILKKLIIILASSLGFYFSAQEELTIIRSLDLEGNKNLPKTEINYIIRQKPRNFFFRSPQFDPRLVRLDALTLKNYYYSKGFLDVNIEESFKTEKLGQKKYADILYEINEGKQYYLSKVSVNGNELVSKSKIKDLLKLKLNKPYNPIGLNDNLYKLENEYHELGKLFFSISVKDNIADSVNVVLNIDEGRFAYINNTIIQRIGNIDTSIVLRELNYNSGDLYSKTSIDITANRLRELGIFSTANISPIKLNERDSLVNIIIELRRYKQREWNSSGGLEPIRFAQGAEPLSALGATIEWRNRAFFNTPKQFSIKFLAGIPFEDVDLVIPRFGYDASLSSNWFMGIRFPTKARIYYDRFIVYEGEDFKEAINRRGADLTQRIQINGRSFFETRSVWQSFSDKSADVIEEQSIGIKINLDYKDDPLYTKSGYLIGMMIKVAGFGGSRKYFKSDFTSNFYYPITNRSVFAMRSQIGRLWGWTYDAEDYSYEKFYLGGSTSMRGWPVLRFNTNENNEPIGKTFRLMTNLELRQKLYKSLGMTIFADGGLLSDSIPDQISRMLKWDGGIGITFDTPLGPARIDYAFQMDNLSKREVQLGVQSLF